MIMFSAIYRLAIGGARAVEHKGFQKECVVKHVVLNECNLLPVLFAGTQNHDIQRSL